MWKILLKQIWAYRKKNSWIFLELLIVSVVMWWMVDPLFVLWSNKSIPLGYDYSQAHFSLARFTTKPEGSHNSKNKINEKKQA